jgi:transposase-like protein
MDKSSKMLLLVKQWEESGLSRVAFAKQHGITLRSLEYWCRKQKKGQIKQPAPASFIEIVSNSKAITVSRQAQIEVELASGLRIKIY